MSDQVVFIDPQDVQDLIDVGAAYVVDVREENEHAVDRIEEAKLISLSRFDPAEITPAAHQKLIFHCESGIRCGKAADLLIAQGYTGVVFRMTGGMKAWRAAGLPVEN